MQMLDEKVATPTHLDYDSDGDADGGAGDFAGSHRHHIHTGMPSPAGCQICKSLHNKYILKTRF